MNDTTHQIRATVRKTTRGPGSELPEGEMEFVASTERRAADGLIIRKQAWTDSVARGQESSAWPPGLAGHLHREPDTGMVPVVAKTLDARWVDGEGFVIRIKWASEDINPIAPRLQRAYEEGFLTDISVGWGETQLMERDLWEDDDTPEVVNLRWDEWSCVSVGSDSGAKKRAHEAGIDGVICHCSACLNETALLVADRERARRQAEEDQKLAVADPEVADTEIADGDEEDADGDVVVDDDTTGGERRIVANHAECKEDGMSVGLVGSDGELIACFASTEDAKAEQAKMKGKSANTDNMKGEKAAPVGDQRSVSIEEIVANSVGFVRGNDGRRKTLTRGLEQWLEDGDTVRPFATGELQPEIRKNAYRIIDDWRGLRFEKMTPVTDELFLFTDSPMESTLSEVDEFWERAEDYAKLKLLHKRGVLLEGPPGTGKTSALYQVSDLMVERGDVVFFANDPYTIEAGLQAFREIEPTRPVVVVIEDVDDTMQCERAMLRLLDGDGAFDGVLYLATTNYLSRFSRRLLRPGRFDRIVHVGPPPEEGRLAYLQHKLKDSEDSEDEIKRLAAETEGFSFGHLRELVIAVYALKEDADVALARLKDVERSAHAGYDRSGVTTLEGSRDINGFGQMHGEVHLSGVSVDISDTVRQLDEVIERVGAAVDGLEQTAVRMAGAVTRLHDDGDDNESTSDSDTENTSGRDDIRESALDALQRELEECGEAAAKTVAAVTASKGAGA